MAAKSETLERSIGTPMLAIYGFGTILGAGIYVLIGKISGHAGYWTPVAFALAASVAGINGIVYAELASRRPAAGGPSAYVDDAFGRSWLSILLGWMIVATGLVSAATIAEGFSGYLLHFVELPGWLPSVVLLVALGAIASLGAKESAWFMAVTTALGVIGLLFVVWVGFSAEAAAAGESVASRMPSLTETGVIASLLTGAFLAMYSFIGFEDMVHMAEEVEEPSRAMPRAILIAIVVAAVFYCAVSLASLRVLTPQQLGKSEAPLVDVVNQAGYPGWPLALLSLWIILNGALAQIIMASRVIYSLKDRGGAPGWLAAIHDRTHTPVMATVASTAVALTLALFLPLETLAMITSLIILLVFAASNAALIVLEKRKPEAPFDVPVWVPWAALIVCLAMIAGRAVVGGGGH